MSGLNNRIFQRRKMSLSKRYELIDPFRKKNEQLIYGAKHHTIKAENQSPIGSLLSYYFYAFSPDPLRWTR